MSGPAPVPAPPPPLDPRTSWVDRAREGDPAAWRALYDAHAGRLVLWLRQTPTGDPAADADDLAMEAWAVAASKIADFHGDDDAFAGWLFGIARNVLLAHFRSQKRVVDIAAGPTTVDDWALVDARLDASAATQRLRSALAAMPAEEREVLLLVAWEELTPTEAAGVLGIPAGTARSRLHRARTRLITHASDNSEREAIS